MDGLAQALDNLEVQYTYHVHEGSAGTTANGCYTKAEVHNHVTTCYAKCTGTIIANGQNTQNSDGTYNCMGTCNSCGKVPTLSGFTTSKKNGDSLGSCIFRTSTLICGKSTNAIYALGCGKTEETIESATIIY